MRTYATFEDTKNALKSVGFIESDWDSGRLVSPNSAGGFSVVDARIYERSLHGDH